MTDLTPAFFDDGLRGAISMTYDDALDQHLDIAMPQLESFGLRGTFYIPTRLDSAWKRRPGDWKAAMERAGHEIANHTQYHPCGMRGRAWVKPNFSLEAYTLERIEQELIHASRDLAEELGEQQRSYAYTCGDDWVGPERVSFRHVVSRLFPAARGVGDHHLIDPYDCEMNFLPGWAMDESTVLDDVIDFIDRAVEEQRWGVLVFHGVGGGHHINVSQKFHLEILGHIASLRATLWCDTFVKVAQQISQRQQRK